jgi:hypothetical protein
MESAWDRDLADVLTPKEPEWFTSQGVIDLAPDLELASSTAAAYSEKWLNIDLIFDDVSKLIEGKPIVGQLESPIGADLSRVHRKIDRLLELSCQFLRDRQQWLEESSADVADMVRWQIRLHSAMAAAMHVLYPGPSVDRARFDCYRRLYVAMAMIECRVKHSNQAFESIWLARERKPH